MKTVVRLLVALLLTAACFSQSDDFVAPNENLVVEGVPKIPAALAEKAQRYTEFRSAGFSSWHPVRREMLAVTRFADTPQVHLIKFPAGARTQLTFFPDGVRAGIWYEPTKGDSFCFLKDVGGGEFYQLYIYDFASGDITLLTDGKSRNTDPTWSYQGDRIAFGSTRRDGNDVDIWTVSPSDPASAKMVAQLEGGGWPPSDWSPDGSTLTLINGVSAAESYVWLLDVPPARRNCSLRRMATTRSHIAMPASAKTAKAFT